GFKGAIAREPRRADARSYPRGTFGVRTQRNAATLHDRIAELARRAGVAVVAVQSAYPDTIAPGVGSDDVVSLHAPRIVVAAGEGVDQESYGTVWQFLAHDLGVPFTPIPLANLASVADLSDYNVLIIPDGGEPHEAPARRRRGDAPEELGLGRRGADRVRRRRDAARRQRRGADVDRRAGRRFDGEARHHGARQRAPGALAHVTVQGQAGMAAGLHLPRDAGPHALAHPRVRERPAAGLRRGVDLLEAFQKRGEPGGVRGRLARPVRVHM